MALNTQDLRTKTSDELSKMAVDLRKEQMNLRFSLAGSQLENTAQMRILRRDIARVKTVARQVETGTLPAAKAAPKKAAAKPAEKAKPAAKKATKAAPKKAAAKDKGDA